MRISLSYPVRDVSQVGEARRGASALAKDIGFTETEVGKLSIIVNELANNLIKHTDGKGGELVFRALGNTLGAPYSPARGIEILSLDRGPGMANVSQCLRDGYSTAGSPGTGLGAVGRISSFLEVYSVLGLGTSILTRLLISESDQEDAVPFEIGAICLPIKGEVVSGDGWVVSEVQNPSLVLIVDGLGHGHFAAQAAEEAMRIFRENQHRPDIYELFARIHEGLRATRGASLGIVALDFSDRRARFIGVGNTSGTLVQPGNFTKSFVSFNGTVGVEIRKVQEFSYSMEENSILVLQSDGLITHWKLDRYPGLQFKSASMIAGVLYRDFKRGNDDITVVVVKRKDI